MERLISRREAMEKISAGVLLSLGFWPGALSAFAKNEEQKSFKFIVVNDLHCLSKECEEWLRMVVAQMRKIHNVDFCIIAGDLTEKAELKYLSAVKEIFSALSCPFYVQIGNHDYIIPTSRWTYERVFPHRLNYWFEHRGWQFVGLDTTDGQKYEKTKIQAETFKWVDKNIRKIDKRKPTVIFTHFPLGSGTKYRPLNADDLLDRFREHNLRAVFSGHFHGFTEVKKGETIFTTNKCCALKRGNHDKTTEKGYFVITVKDGVMYREFVQHYIPDKFLKTAKL
ncbi:MAG: metallophosphoesterase family protein [Verrucomicrobiia bacterium]